MGVVKGIGLLAGIAGVGIVLFAQKRSAATGKDVGEILGNLPEELRQYGDEMKLRLKESVTIGKDAAAERETEIDQMIAEEEAKLEAAAAQAPLWPGSAK